LVEVTEKGKIMAEPATVADVYMLAGQHGDIRREAAEYSANIRRETAFEAGDIRRDVAQSAFNVSTDVGNATDRSMANDTAYYIASTAAAAQTAKEAAKERGWIEAGMNAGFVKVAGDQALATAVISGHVALEASKLQGALALQSAILAQQVSVDGAATRMLINEQRAHEQTRMLIERNAALVEAHGDARFWRHGAQNAQFAAVTSQVNALGSQLQETRQGMVNFGTQTGVGQTSTSNQV
jgi:hypothetical protein